MNREISLITTIASATLKPAWLKETSPLVNQARGMSKVAYHRLLVEGLEVVERATRRKTIGPPQNDNRSISHERNAMKLCSMRRSTC